MNNLNKGFVSIMQGFKNIFKPSSINYEKMIEMPYDETVPQIFDKNINHEFDPKDPFNIIKK